MVTININENLNLGMEEILQGIAKLGAKDKKRFYNEVTRLTVGKQGSLLSKKEQELLISINKKFPIEVQERYAYLRDKNKTENISKEEKEEFLQLLNKFENRNYSWLKAIIELAQMWNLTPRELMKKLEINQEISKEN